MVSQLTGRAFRELIKGPLKRIGATIPDLRRCEFHAALCPSRLDVPQPESTFSGKAALHLAKLNESLDEVMAWWSEEKFRSDLLGRPTRSMNIQSFAVEPLNRLRASLNECGVIVQPAKALPDEWEPAAATFAKVFIEAAKAGGAAKVPGLSLNGPLHDFVCEGLKELGWMTPRHPTPAAVLQFLKRNRDKLNDGVCPGQMH